MFRMFSLEADTTEMSHPKMSSFSHGCRIARGEAR